MRISRNQESEFKYWDRSNAISVFEVDELIEVFVFGQANSVDLGCGYSRRGQSFPCFTRTWMRIGGLLVMSHGSKFESHLITITSQLCLG